MVIPTTASRASMMIWTTAKLTEVKSRHSPLPTRAAGLRAGLRGPAGRTAAGRVLSAVSVAMEVVASAGSGSGRNGAGRGLGFDRSAGHVLRRADCPVEVGNEIVDVLEADADPEQARHDPGLEQLGLR